MEDLDEQHVKPSGAHPEPPPPRQGDEFTGARIVINAARLVMPAGSPCPHFTGDETTAEPGVPVPRFVPVQYGWLDAYSGELANPRNEPGAEGRRYA